MREWSLLVKAHYCSEGHCSYMCNPWGCTERITTTVQYIKFTMSPPSKSLSLLPVNHNTPSPCLTPASLFSLSHTYTHTLTPQGLNSQITLQHCVKLNSFNYTYLTTRMFLGNQPECVCFGHRSIVPMGFAHFSPISSHFYV